MASRRKVLVGLGAIVAGGGAAIGSGAFDSAEATRDVEVNVVTDEDIAAEFVDVLIQDPGRWNSVEVGDDEPENLFPQNDGDLDDATAQDVSLIQEDVTITFGPEGNALPPNMDIDYDDFFLIINDEGEEATDFEVTLEFGGFDQSSFTVGAYDETVTAGTTAEADLTLETGDESDTGVLTITIEGTD